MAAATFGITYTDLEREFQGWDFDDLSADVTAWTELEAAALEVRLRQVGYDPATVEGWTSTDTLYRLAKDALLHGVAARMMAALNIDATELGVDHRRLAADAFRLIRTMPESVSENYDPDEQFGGPRSNKRLKGRGRDTWKPPSGSGGPWWDREPVI